MTDNLPIRDPAAFLLEYEALCRKHGLFIGITYCCCGNWSIDRFDEEEWAEFLSDMKNDIKTPILPTLADIPEFLCKDGNHDLITVQLATGPHQYCNRCEFGRNPEGKK